MMPDHFEDELAAQPVRSQGATLMTRKRLLLTSLLLALVLVVVATAVILGMPTSKTSQSGPPIAAGTRTPSVTPVLTPTIFPTRKPDTPTPTVPPPPIDHCSAPASQNSDLQQHGDFYLGSVTLLYSNPFYQIPDLTPNKPFIVPANYKQVWFNPVNPDLTDVGLSFSMCNGSLTTPHSIQSMIVKVLAFTPYTGQLNEADGCFSVYNNQSVIPITKTCDGVAPFQDTFQASFAPTDGAGASATVSYVNFTFKGSQVFGPLPFTLQPDQSMSDNILITPPTVPGFYTLGLDIVADGATLPFESVKMLLAPATVTWSGDACLQPAMQAQIPAGDTNSYICPGN